MPGTGSAGKIRVLLIDDEQAIVKILKRLFELSGMEVSEAGDGEEGLTKARAQRPDAIVLDLMLPKLNGFEVCQALKGDPGTSGIPIYIFSARGRQEEARCREAGAAAFFSKTDPAANLIAIIKARFA